MTTDLGNDERASKRRVNFDCDMDLFEAVKAYRFEAHHDTMTEAFVALWRLGLEAFKGRGERIRKGEQE